MKCLSINTKSGKPCQNKRVNCRWHPWQTILKQEQATDTVVSSTIRGRPSSGVTLTKADDYEPSWWLDGLLLKLFRRKGKK